MGKGIAVTTVWASSGITSHGTKVVGIIGMECVSRDELEAHGLKGARVCKEDALGECRENG